MKTLVVESTPTVIRWRVENEADGSQLPHQSHNLIGNNHTTVRQWTWTCGEEKLSAFSDERKIVGELWRQLLDPNLAHEHHEILGLVVDAAVAAIGRLQSISRVVFLVPESLPEASQNMLVSELSRRFKVAQDEVYLLWRSVAIALSVMEDVRDCSKLVIVDFAHHCAEAARLGIRNQSNQNCPVRDFTRHRGSGLLSEESLIHWMNLNYTMEGAKSDPWQCGAGAQMAERLERDTNFDPPIIWRPNKLNFQPVNVSHDDFARPGNFEQAVAQLRKFIAPNGDLDGTRVVWHGWPVYWHGAGVMERQFPNSLLAEPDAALAGGFEFARRHRLKKPTYIEVLPGYSIWCQTGELGLPRRWQWESLIAKREIDGTKTVKDAPNSRFQLNAGTSNYEISVRMGESTHYRYIKTELPNQLTDAARILIHSQIRPTGGGVKLALAPRDEPDLFGRNAQIALKWETAEERRVSELLPPSKPVEVHRYSYPFIIQSEGSSKSRLLLENIGASIRTGGAIQNYVGALGQILVPTFANAEIGIPFGGRRVRAVLSKNVHFLVNEICRFAYAKTTDNVNAPGADWKWTRLASCLFFYTDEEIQNALYDRVMKADYPIMGGGAAIPLSQAFYAFGRTCRNAKHLERFLRRVLGDWDNLARAPWVVFWPFQKCLGYYGEPARVPSDLVASVMRCAVELLDRIIEGRLPAPQVFGMSNWKKWTLSAILFGLRRRELDSKFMDLDRGDALAADVRARLLDPEIFNTPIPPIALAGIEIAGDPPSLPELILRFLEARADETDIAIAGGIGLNS